jgi:hypothetical protein
MCAEDNREVSHFVSYSNIFLSNKLTKSSPYNALGLLNQES